MTTNPQADKEPAKAKVELKVELKELQMQVEKKGDISGEHFIAHCLRYIGRLAPDILDVVIATLGSPVGGLMLVIKKLAEKAKELAGKS
ncbi:MAG: hypothetical protein HYZ49_03850 [Chloroflexi bacterium]|nr:hypothetical protein [Chloroflexota bacterium]